MADTPITAKGLARGTLLRLTNPRLIAPARKNVDGSIYRVVVVRPDHLGDLLFATPALELIRQAFPAAHITGLVGPWGRAMWQGNPNLDALETVDFPGIAAEKDGSVLAPYRLLNATAETLSTGTYDLGIVLRFDHWWGAALLAAAGIPRRWGYDTPGMGSWLTNVAPYQAGKHEVEQNLALVDAITSSARIVRQNPMQVSRAKGVPKLRPPQPEAFANQSLSRWLVAPQRVVIHPGTAAANKLWTINGWARVARTLIYDGSAVAITGSPDEKELADAITKAVGSLLPIGNVLVNMAGQTANLAQLTWVLECANMVLGVDNGPLHIADALSKPSLHLYGPSDETIWGPWGDPNLHRAFRAPGTRPVAHLDVGSQGLEGGPEMRAITSEMVTKEIRFLTENND